jgi:hypothetical protein
MVRVFLLRVIDHRAGSFFSFFFFVVCMFVVFGLLVVAVDGCNCSFAILIYFLYQKNMIV